MASFCLYPTNFIVFPTPPVFNHSMFFLYLGDEDGKDGDDDQVFSSREDEIAKVAAKYHKLIGNIKVFLFPKQKESTNSKKKTFFRPAEESVLTLATSSSGRTSRYICDCCKQIQI